MASYSSKIAIVLRSVLAAIAGGRAHEAAPVVSIVETPDGGAVNLQGNPQGCEKVDGTLADWGAHTPSGTAIADGPCHAIWVTDDDAVVTGTSAGGTTGDTPALPKQQWIPMSFGTITNVSAGSVYIGWYRK